jgi:predicted exporter
MSLHNTVAWARRRRAQVLSLAAGLFALSLVGITHLRFDTDVLSLLPRSGAAIPAFREFLRHFGGIDQLYVVFTAPPGHRIDEYRPQIDVWIAGLRALPDVTRVDAGTLDTSRDWAWIADRQLLLLRSDHLSAALARLHPTGMHDAIVESRALLAMPSSEVREMVRQDPLGLLRLLRDDLGQAQAGLNVGGGPDGYLTADGRRRLVVARPSRPPFDTKFSHALFARLDGLRQSIAAASATAAGSIDEPLPQMTVDFAGGHRIAVETEQTIRRESISNSIGSLALILPLLFLVFRSLWLVAVGPLPSALALVIVLGILGFSGATLSAAAAGSAAMMFGLGVDGVVLLYATHHRAQIVGLSENEVSHQLTGVSASMLLGMWTTAATFYGLMFVDFPSLTQLGALVGHSMVVCGVVTLLLVPALLPRRRLARSSRPILMPALAGYVLRHRRRLLSATAIATLILAALATRIQINPTLERMRSTSAGAQLEVEMAHAFGLPDESYILLSRGTSLERLLQQNERLADEIGRVVPAVGIQTPSMLLPSNARQAAVRARVAQEHFSPEAIVTGLRREAIDAGFKADAFEPFEQRIPRLTDPGASVTAEGYAEHGLGDLLDRFVAREGANWVLATYVFPKTPAQLAMLEQIVTRLDGHSRLTGVPLVNRELAAAFVPQFLRGLVLGAIAVVVLIAVTFRDWRLSVLALLPTIAGLIWAAGLLGILRAELDLFAMFAVVTFIGIGVDYGVHLVHRFQECGDIGLALSELAPVILVAGMITVFGYGTLVTSSYPPLRSMGLVSVVSVISLVAASVLMLPNLLSFVRIRRD